MIPAALLGGGGPARVQVNCDAIRRSGMCDKSLIRADEDVGLMLKAREGDRSAYEKVYTRYFQTVISFLARRVTPSSTCEDLAQEVFARVWSHRSRYQPLAPVRSYLLGVAANVLRENRARSHPGVPLEACDLEVMPDTSLPAPSSQAQSAEQRWIVRRLMAGLPARQRQALELVYLVGLDPDEVARRLGCSRQTLYSHLSAARERLRQCVRRSQEK